MKYAVLFLSLFCIAGGYYYFDYRLSIARKQQMIASNQYNALREDYKKTIKTKSESTISRNRNTNISIKFITPVSKAGITNLNISLYIAPLYDSPIIKLVNIRMEVNILDSAIINNQTWFYVALPLDTNINSRGWINKNDFSTLYSNSNAIRKSY
ncbi:MAG: hypothetical protein ACRC68_04970 [Clostridium sp.]